VKTADWALVVSLFSALLSLAGFVWNIWSKFIYPKAKIKVSIGIWLSMDGDGTPARKFINLSATNYGPTEITLHSHAAKRRQGFFWFNRNRYLALINPVAHPDSSQPTGRFAPGFPKKLAIGEKVDVYFSRDAPKGWVEEGDLYYFGFADTFGRYHWCSHRNAKKFRAHIVKDFGAVAPRKAGLIKLITTKLLWSRASQT
jgi:hypothetical protein